MYSEPNQIHGIKCFAEIVNGSQKLTVFTKSHILMFEF